MTITDLKHLCERLEKAGQGDRPVRVPSTFLKMDGKEHQVPFEPLSEAREITGSQSVFLVNEAEELSVRGDWGREI